MKGTVIIDCLPESAERYRDRYAIVVVDVIRATTVATTAVSMGRRVFPAKTTDDACVIAETLIDPLLVGELGGNKPYGFHMTNSPVQVAARVDLHRPMVMVSTSGTQLLLNAVGSEAVYLACLRNFSAVARHIDGSMNGLPCLGRDPGVNFAARIKSDAPGLRRNCSRPGTIRKRNKPVIG